MQAIARAHQRSPEQVFFSFVQRLGITPLTGTTSPQHMREDLDVTEQPVPLTAEDMKALDRELIAAATVAAKGGGRR